MLKKASFIGLAAFVVVLLIHLSHYKVFDHDEFEHVHAAWYISQGCIPYADFFEHHHPALWYALALPLKIFLPTAELLLWFRLLSVCGSAFILFLTYTLAREADSNLPLAILAAFTPLTSHAFLNKAVEIRPDIPMMCLCLASLVYFLRFCRTWKNNALMICGLLAGIALLFSQKALYFCGVLLVTVAILRIQKRIPTWRLAQFAACLMAPTGLMAITFALTGHWKVYWISCWELNTYWIVSATTILTRILAAFKNPLPLFIVTSWWLYTLLKFRSIAAYTLFFTLCGWGLLSLLPAIVYDQYMFPLLPLSAVCVAWGISQWKINAVVFRCALTGLVIWMSVAGLHNFQAFTDSDNRRQLERINFVLKRTSTNDTVYDGDIQFNIFRKDPGYYWLSSMGKQGVELYRQEKLGIKETLTVDTLLEMKPRIISLFRIKDSSSISEHYRPVKFGLYELRVKNQPT
jgi:hypothetical protein